jgi:superfamily II DNA or RNA helicase
MESDDDSYNYLRSSEDDSVLESYENPYNSWGSSEDDTLDSGEEDSKMHKRKYINMTSIANAEFLQDHELDVSRVPVLNINQWPSKEALGLDESQYRACQLALTSRFALIQGPPGTGKTYVGLKIAQALLDNQELWSGEDKSPILMVSYTNHALDQFLMGLVNKEGNECMPVNVMLCFIIE